MKMKKVMNYLSILVVSVGLIVLCAGRGVWGEVDSRTLDKKVEADNQGSAKGRILGKFKKNIGILFCL